MNKSILIMALVAGTIFTSCKSAAQKESAAKQNVVEAKQDVTDAKQDVTDAKQDLKDTKISNANERLEFKTESLKKIRDNDAKIADLKVQVNKPSKTFDCLYRTRIEKLEAKNKELKIKIKNYDGNETEWKTLRAISIETWPKSEKYKKSI